MGVHRKLAATCTGLAFALMLGGGAIASQNTKQDARAKLDDETKSQMNAQEAAPPQDCRNIPTSSDGMPAWVVRCGNYTKVATVAPSTPEVNHGPILMQEVSNNTVRDSSVAGIATTTSFGALVPPQATSFPADFIRLLPDTQRVYQITSSGLVSRYTATGANTVMSPIAPPTGQTWSDTATDPTTGTVYGAAIACGTASSLSILDIHAGTRTAVGPITNAACLISLAADNAGNLWGIDIVSDSLISVNKLTGAGTVVGPIGYDSNFGQAFDCDPSSGTCYIFGVNVTAANANQLHSVNLVTGATTLVGTIGSTSPGGATQEGGAVFLSITDTCNADPDCQDGNICNGAEVCVANACQPGTPVNCDDAQVCTTDVCAPSTGQCSHPPNTCDDNNLCTQDSCDTQTGCQHVASCQQFCVGAPIAIPSSGTSTPYPSTINVAGLGSVASLSSVVLQNLSHTFPDDIDMLLVGPLGQNAIIMSDVGGSIAAVNVTLTLADSAATSLPDAGPLATGTFKPTNIGAGDAFAAPAPAPSGNTTLGVFNNLNPNGAWKLYVVDDLGGDSGTVQNWCLNIVVASCANDADCGDGNPCTDDTCVNTNCVHANNSIPCNDSSACTANDTCTNGACVGIATDCNDNNFCTTDGCNPGTGLCTHGVTNCADADPCTFDSCSGGSCIHNLQCTEICNQTPTQLLDSATPPTIANPYPTQIVVSGVSGTFSLAAVKLNGISHTFPDDLDMLLVGPGGQNAKIMSDVGGGGDITGVNLTLSDTATTSLPDGGPLVTGMFKPTDVADGTDTYPAPAPAPAGGSALSVFTGTNPNGTWKLYSVDDANIDSGTMAAWCIDLLLSCSVNSDCDDADPCTVDTCNGTVCQHTGSGSPGEVTGDSFPNKTTYTWSPAAGATLYDVVRGLASALPVGPGGGDEVCFGNNPTTSLVDATLPPVGESFFYVVRGKNVCAPPGTYGTASDTTPRTTTTCP